MISKGQKPGKDKSEGSVAKSERQLGWHYLAVIKLSALLRGKTSKHHTVFLCFNFFHFFVTENKLQQQKRVCEIKDFRNIIIPSEGTKILEFNQCQKSDKASFIIFGDPDCITRKIYGPKNKHRK